MKTAKDFSEVMGYEPGQDDMERANCPDAGQIGHLGCGWCVHGKPVFLCLPCFENRCRGGHEAFWLDE